MCNVRCAARDQRPAANDRQRLAAYDPSGSAPMRGGIRRVGVVLPVVFRMTGCQNGRLLKKLPMRTISETRVRSRRSIQAPSVNQICRFAHLGYRSPPIARIDPAPNRSQPAFFQASGRFACTRQAPRRRREPYATRTAGNAGRTQRGPRAPIRPIPSPRPKGRFLHRTLPSHDSDDGRFARSDECEAAPAVHTVACRATPGATGRGGLETGRSGG